MRKIIVLIKDMLGYYIEQSLGKPGIVKYAISENPWLSGERGRIDKLVWYKRKGELITRRRPQSFIIKDPAYFKGRFDRFKAFVQLTKCYNHDLADLYEKEDPKLTFYNILTRQLNKFWVGGPAPAPYTFAPGVAEVAIGNGTMPDARDIVFTATAGLHLGIAWDKSLLFENENNDDLLQVMLVKDDGTTGVWMPETGTPPVQRSAGTATIVVPGNIVDSSSTKIYCAIKFKAGADLAGKVKGIFRFPVGIQVITLLS